MRIKIIMVPVLALLCLASTANAALVQATGTITGIITGDGGEGIYVTITGVSSSTPPHCSVGFLLMATGAAQYSTTVAILIAVRAQGLPITVTYDNQNCSSTNPGAFNLYAVNY